MPLQAADPLHRSEKVVDCHLLAPANNWQLWNDNGGQASQSWWLINPLWLRGSPLVHLSEDLWFDRSSPAALTLQSIHVRDTESAPDAVINVWTYVNGCKSWLSSWTLQCSLCQQCDWMWSGECDLSCKALWVKTRKVLYLYGVDDLPAPFYFWFITCCVFTSFPVCYPVCAQLHARTLLGWGCNMLTISCQVQKTVNTFFRLIQK